MVAGCRLSGVKRATSFALVPLSRREWARTVAPIGQTDDISGGEALRVGQKLGEKTYLGDNDRSREAADQLVAGNVTSG